MKVSIITINYNKKEGLTKTIKSVLSQTYSNIQYIVIDGASTDGSVDVIKDNSEFIDYWVSEPDNGIYHAMNKGVDRAEGDYFLFLNSGDYLHSDDIVERTVSKLNDYDIVMGKAQCTPSGLIGWTDLKLPFTLLDFYKGSPVPHPATFIKRTIFEKYRYDESLKIVSDWKFFMQAIIFSKSSCKIIDDIVSYMEEGGISSNPFISEEERENVLKEMLPETIRLDYMRFVNGSEYTEGVYDRFFVSLRRFKYSRIIYTLSVVLVRIISLFRPSARFSRNVPLLLKSNKTV